MAMVDPTAPSTGMPVPPAVAARLPPANPPPVDNVQSRLQTGLMAQGLGMMPAGVPPAPTQGPDTAPLPVARPTDASGSTVAFTPSPASPPPRGMPMVPSVAGGGFGGPTMTPQELVAAKQASVAPFFQGVIGPGAVAARQDLTRDVAAGNYGAAAGDAVRGVGLSAAHIVSQPVVSAAEALGHGMAYVAHGVGSFARGLFGAPAEVAPAAPTPAATPQVVAPAAPAAPAAAPANPRLAAALSDGSVRAVAMPDGSTTLVAGGGGMPTPAAAAAAPAARSDLEKATGAPAGFYDRQMAHLPVSQRLAFGQQSQALEGAAKTATLHNALVDQIFAELAQGQTRKPGQSDADFNAQRAQALENFRTRGTALASAASITAGLPGNLYQSPGVQ